MMASAVTNDSDSDNDEAMRKLLKPDPTPEDIIEILRECYYVSSNKKRDNDGNNKKKDVNSIIKIKKELDSYDDKNYWVKIDDVDYLAKVHNGVESKNLLDCIESGNVTKSVIYLQNSMMDHLTKEGVSTSQPQKPTNIIISDQKSSSRFAEEVSKSVSAIVKPLPVASKEHSPCNLIVRLMSWVSGRPMEAVPLLPLESLADAGRFLGKMQHALSSMELPGCSDDDNNDDSAAAAKRYHQWDGKNTNDLTNFVSYIQDDTKRTMVKSVIDTFNQQILDSKIAENETKFPKALIHGDFNDANILVNEDLLVSGVIDFGDSVESWRILDVSVGIAYSMLSTYGKQGRAISAGAAFLRGYSSVMTLTKEEREHLVLLIACRLACSATLGAYSYSKAPENEYLLLHAVPAWNTLQLIWGGTDEKKRAETHKAINRIFDLACSSSAVEDGNVIDCSDLAFPDPSIGDPLKDLRVPLGNV